ncbi:MAG TPA: helix-turn-helix domain-containing protein [Solirubrobacterales bacterium]|nr:helix-turn-helix domain-containing protein [Solirubrobacterales bacterium]
MSTQKTKNRKYELKARAESQEQTRQRIAAAAAGLHEEVGPAETTVAEIARRAGVSRLTVYKHFPDNAALYPACSAHYASEHPLPDFGAALAREDPVDRVRSLLRTVYRGLYRERRRMMRNLNRDRRLDPALDEFMRANADVALAGLADAATAGFELEGERAARVRSLIAVALDFWTWERLTDDGLDDEAAADLMTEAVAAMAGDAKQAPAASR